MGIDRYGREIPAGCKDVKLSLTNAWRTTYTHIQAGDVVRIETEGSKTKAAPPAAPKRSYWATVTVVENKGRVVRLVMEQGEITEEPAHTAITRQERVSEYEARLAADAETRRASVEASAAILAEAKRLYPATATEEARGALAHEVTQSTLEAEHAGFTVMPITVGEYLSAGEPTAPALITGHKASSHSRRGAECRVCGQLVTDHEEVDVAESLSVAYWTGTVYGYTVDPERVAIVEALVARQEQEAELLAKIETWQAGHHGDGLFLPDGYSHVAHMALWEANRIVPGSKTSGAGGKLGWYSVRMIDADHEEALRINDSLYVAPVPHILGKCECESFICFHNGTHPMYSCDQPASTTDWVDLCTGCKATVDQPVSPEARTAFQVWVEAEAARRKAEEEAEVLAGLASLPPVGVQVAEILQALTPVACDDCGVSPHDDACGRTDRTVTLSGNDLSMIDDAADLDRFLRSLEPTDPHGTCGSCGGSLDPWAALRSKRKATKVTRRAWQGKLNRKGR
jgi:hypothetical protein